VSATDVSAIKSYDDDLERQLRSYPLYRGIDFDAPVTTAVLDYFGAFIVLSLVHEESDESLAATSARARMALLEIDNRGDAELAEVNHKRAKRAAALIRAALPELPATDEARATTDIAPTPQELVRANAQEIAQRVGMDTKAALGALIWDDPDLGVDLFRAARAFRIHADALAAQARAAEQYADEFLARALDFGEYPPGQAKSVSASSFNIRAKFAPVAQPEPPAQISAKEQNP
jgi:hypothetical protein